MEGGPSRSSGITRSHPSTSRTLALSLSLSRTLSLSLALSLPLALPLVAGFYSGQAPPCFTETPAA